MSSYRLDRLFTPRSVALVGASPRKTSVGRAILKNLHDGGFEGPIQLVNPRHAEVEGIAAVRDIAGLAGAPDLVIIAAPPPAVPGIVEAAGAKGCQAAIIITAGLGRGPGSLAESAERAARGHGLRLLGPNCLGLQIPPVKLNASFAAHMSPAGDLALISQSGAIAAGLIEWATKRSVGFSAVVSLGDQIDVDFGDLLDHFSMDRGTRAILLYVESIGDARKFMSAARAAARIKPVVVIKSGRHAQGATAARTHTGALAGSDAVYAAAFHRAGLVRVMDLDELFDAAETLGRQRPFLGRRLAILTNGGGIGVLAVDRLVDLQGSMAAISPATMAALDAALPPIWSKSNPVDIAGDADAARYTTALQALLADPENDAVLVMNVPTALASAAAAAGAVTSVVSAHRNAVFPPKPVFASWVGDSGDAAAMFEAAAIPNYASESDAIRGFMHLVQYREAHDALMQTPPNLPQDFAPDAAKARQVVRDALDGGRDWLDPIEIEQLLAAYALPHVPAILARDPDDAATLAKQWLANGQSVAIKILSPDIVHKSDVGGVRLGLATEAQVREATADILKRARAARPDARITGVTIHPMIVRPKARELIAGIADDSTFGPVVMFGCGGTAVEVIDDKALALPPLDLRLAHELIGRTRISRLLKAYRNVPAADENAIALTLVKLAQLAADIPEIREIDLNPLLADETGVIALDARVAVAPLQAIRRGASGHPRFAVRPYPKDWERPAALRDGTSILMRPVRPEDEPLYYPFFARVDEYDLRLRFFAPIKTFSHEFIARFTQLDYARAMAFIAVEQSSGQMLGVARLHTNADYNSAEYAVLVRSDLKGKGLGWLLMKTIIEYARSEGIREIEGQVLRENAAMLRMCSELGFRLEPDPHDPDTYVARLPIKRLIATADGQAQS